MRDRKRDRGIVIERQSDTKGEGEITEVISTKLIVFKYSQVS